LDDPSLGLVAGYTIDRGRSFELDRTDAGTAKIEIFDRNGVLDPTNAGGPYLAQLQPLKQAGIALYDPIAAAWNTIFRGYIEDYDYSLDQAQNVMKLTLSLVDGFGILSAAKMYPDGTFGDDPATAIPQSAAVGNVFFADAVVNARCTQVLGNLGWPTSLQRIFTGNVVLQAFPYTPGESVLTVLQDAADAEFPGVANVYMDRQGILAWHGRFARFTPVGVSTSTSWDFRHYKCGDYAACVANVNTVPIRTFQWNRGWSKVRNYALATPQGIADAAVAGQVSKDTTSIGLYGIQSWDAQNLLLKGSRTGANVANPNAEAKLYSNYIRDNYATPLNRITSLVFGTPPPNHIRAAKLWTFLTHADISDMIDVTVSHPGGGGFNNSSFYIEGLHYTARPLAPGLTAVVDVELSLDVSPVGFYTNFAGTVYDPTTQ